MRTFVRVSAFVVALNIGLLSLLVGLLPPAMAAEKLAKSEHKGYYRIAVRGAIGRHFTAQQMEAHLKEAERLKPAVVLLEIDSGGGRIDHAEKIVDLIIKHKDLTFVAYVRKALSAAATITLACEKIFVTESATIGGAVSYSVDGKGRARSLPADVAEKFQSIWRAVCRKAAQHGGHPSLIAEAMVDPAFALTMRREGEQVKLERDGRGKVLKAKGRILTLTAREAVSCGLAESLVQDVQAIGQRLALADWEGIGRQEQTEAAAFEVPARLGPKAFARPGILYAVLYRKVVSLGLTDEQTEVQRTKALQEWEKWFGAQNLSGQRVKWSMILLDASESQMRFVPQVVHDAWSRDAEIAGARLGGSVLGPNMTVEQFKKLLEAEEWKIKWAKERLDVERKSQITKQWKVQNYQDRIRDCQKTVSTLRRAQRESEDYPVKVTAKCENEPRIFPVAWVGKRSKRQLTEVDPNAKITLSGEVGQVVPYLSDDGVFLIEVILDKCELATAAEEGGAASDEQAAVECIGWLSMAKNYLRARRPKQAIMYAEKVLEKYGESKYAEEARTVREQALQMENPPPPESEEADSKP